MSSPISTPLRLIVPAVLAFWCATGASADAVEAAGKYRADGELTAAVIELKSALQRNTDDADARALLGDIYLDLGDGAAAEKELRRAAALGRTDLSPLLMRSLLQQGAYRRVLDEFPLPAELPPAERALHFALRGDAHARLGESDAAADAYARALELVPEQADALLGEARLALGQDKRTRANTLVQQALDAAPANAEAWALRARLALLDDDADAAEAAFAKAIEHAHVDFDYRIERALARIERGDYDAAQEDVERLRMTRPDEPAVAYLAGRVAFHTGHFQTAYEQFQRARGVPAFRRELGFYLGASALATGAHEQALELLDRYFSANPTSTTAARLLARARLATGDVDGAEQLLRDVLKTDPEDRDALTLLARIAAATGDTDAAAGYRRRLADAAPDDPFATTALGLTLIKGDAADLDEGLRVLEAALDQQPAQLGADIGIVSALLRKGSFEEARTAALAMAEKYPDNGAPFALAGIARGALGDIEGARADFERALELTPGEPSTAGNLARIALAEGDLDAARRWYRYVLEHRPNDEQTLLKLAQLEARHGDDADAEALLLGAIAAHPRSLTPYLSLTGFYRDRGRPQEALERLLQVQKQFDANPEYWAVVALLQLTEGKPQAAVASLARRVELDPSAAAYLQLANAQAVSGDDAGFAAALLEALQLAPEHPQAGALVSHYIDMARSDDERQRRIERVRAVAPERPEILLLDAAAAAAQKRWPTAEALYRKGADRHPNDGRFVLGLAQGLLAQNRTDAAIATLEDRIARRPADVLALALLAELQLTQGATAAAEATLARAVALAPDNARLHNNLAWLLRERDPARALTHAERAVALSARRDASYLDTLGRIQLGNGDGAAAEQTLQEALSLDPTNPTVQYHYALALNSNGSPDRARRLLLELLAGTRAFPEREHAEALAQTLR